MARNFIILDFLNMAFRAKHMSYQNSGVDMQIGLAMHTILNSIKFSYEKYKGSHLVVCLEGRSWRKDVFPGYKLNRKVKLLGRTQKEQDDDEIFFEAINEFCKYLDEKTNATVLRCPVAEADDMVSMWIDSHPEDNHYIVSTDSDFFQLLSKNVEIYNGVTEQRITLGGVFDKLDKPVLDKNGVEKGKIDPEYVLFEKCIRGDSSDNIFSAYPGVRVKGSKNKVGIIEAFDDRHNKGFAWNNFLMQKWIDENGVENLVKDKYEFNKKLIDLHEQPEDVRSKCLEAISIAVEKPPVQNVGSYFLKFCTLHRLKKVLDYPDAYARILNAKY